MSWDTVNLITAATVKEVTGTNRNVEDRKIDPSIHDAQHDLKQTLGETLYQLIEDADPVNDATLGGNTGLATLYSRFIKNYLSWKTLEYAYPQLYAEADRRGVFANSGEGYTPVDGKTLAMLIAKAAARADNRQGEMIRYIENLDASNAIRVAYDTDVDDEPRTKEVKNTGRIITRVSKWQYPDNRTDYGPDEYRKGGY